MSRVNVFPNHRPKDGVLALPVKNVFTELIPVDTLLIWVSESLCSRISTVYRGS